MSYIVFGRTGKAQEVCQFKTIMGAANYLAMLSQMDATCLPYVYELNESDVKRVDKKLIGKASPAIIFDDTDWDICSNPFIKNLYLRKIQLTKGKHALNRLRCIEPSVVDPRTLLYKFGKKYNDYLIDNIESQIGTGTTELKFGSVRISITHTMVDDEECYKGETFFLSDKVASATLGSFGSGCAGCFELDGNTYKYDRGDEFIAAIKAAYESKRAPSNMEVVRNDPLLAKMKDDVIYDVVGKENPNDVKYYKKRMLNEFLSQLVFTDERVYFAIEENMRINLPKTASTEDGRKEVKYG